MIEGRNTGNHNPYTIPLILAKFLLVSTSFFNHKQIISQPAISYLGPQNRKGNKSIHCAPESIPSDHIKERIIEMVMLSDPQMHCGNLPDQQKSKSSQDCFSCLHLQICLVIKHLLLEGGKIQKKRR